MSAGNSKGNDHFWPGFVDALTNVVIAMVFVIVVLAIALSFAAQLLAQRMAARIAELEQQGKATQVVAAPPAPVMRPGGDDSPRREPTAPATATTSRSPVVERIPVRGTEREQSPPKGAMLQQDDRRLVLDYEPGALTLDTSASQRLAQALAPFKTSLEQGDAGMRVVVVARGPAMDLSENQRSGYLRVMTVRNVLLENGIPASRIDARIDTAARADRPTVDISLERRP